ncbi:MAG: branched-chain amino acid ABC transporter permease [Desulfobacterales bacterium]|nr:branched-chain amino acid ABC transporter permease [Desulfobacterales bacterium]
MQILINGIITGLTIGVLALAFTVVYLPTRIFHIAIAGIYTATPFIAWTFLQDNTSVFVTISAFSVAVLFAVCLSLFCEWVNHSPLERKNTSHGAHLVASLGFYIVIVQIVILFWGNGSKILHLEELGIYSYSSFSITATQALAIIISSVTLLLFYIWLKCTNSGLQFRGLSENPVEFAIKGYSVFRLRMVAFAISGVLCAVASLLLAYDIGFDPHSGLPAFFLAVVAAIIGGRSSFAGPVIGGILLGVVRSTSVWFFSSHWQDVITFILLVLFLYLRPTGLFFRQIRLEAQQ